jgi:hypothetical protein
MRHILLILVFFCGIKTLQSQTIVDIYFNLYTDSLKHTVHNYINVDGKLSNGKFIPLDTTQIKLTANVGKWIGNNLIIDTTYTKDSVVITATLLKNSDINKTVVVYMKKDKTIPILKTENEILHPKRKNKKAPLN